MEIDTLTLGVVALVSGGILGYISKAWRWLYWNVHLPLDLMHVLFNENERMKGKNIRFQEDKVDPLNPTRDSGTLINKKWFCSYQISGKEEKPEISLFGGSNWGNLTYDVSTLRFLRGKIIKLLDKTIKTQGIDSRDKIFIITSSSVFFVGKIEEEHEELPLVIEERLDGQRTTRLNIFLHGPLGTGKTTLARAIAQRMQMPIYILGINSWWDITDFIRALQRIPDESVILFDDLDIVLEQLLRASIDKDNSPLPLKFSTASLMAFLDGIIMKQRKWIVIMCTNEPEKVRRLLRLRPGRVHIDYACTKVYSTDYVEAIQEAEKVIIKIKEEKKREEPKKEEKA